jgi:hypothetical protein
MAGMPQSLDVKQLFDQSIFVRASIQGVLREGAIAAVLTVLMIYAKARVQLERAVGTTLENNGITVDEAMRGKVNR